MCRDDHAYVGECAKRRDGPFPSCRGFLSYYVHGYDEHGYHLFLTKSERFRPPEMNVRNGRN